MTKRVLFQVHWFLGITAGLVLAVMGLTGATMSFEDEISEALSPRLYAPGVPAAPDLSPDRIIARLQAAKPGYYVSRLDWETDRARTHGVRMNTVTGRGRLEGRIDRSTGAWLGAPAAAGFFGVVDGLHRWLALPGGGNGIGRQITGFSAIALIFLALSGLYLRWPRQPLDWRAWLVLDLRRTGRNLWRTLHVVIGTWVLLFYLLSASTGLWWSYDWYRRGVSYALAGKAAGEGRERGAPTAGLAPRPPIDPAWAAFRRAAGDRYAWIRITQPPPGQPVKTIDFDARRADARHLRQTDRFRYDPRTDTLRKPDLYARRPLGQVITQSMFELHRGAFFGLPGRIALLLTSLTMPLFTVTGYLLYLSRRRRQRASRTLDAAGLPEGTGDFLIVFASQTGTAAWRARSAAIALAQGGAPARLVPLSRLTPGMLTKASRVLFVVSTYGEGEPPDMARGFVRRHMGAPLPLAHLAYGMLALGDREYPAFCAFGARMDAWLACSGAQPMFGMIALHHDDPDAAQRWREQLRVLGARDLEPAPLSQPFRPWRLIGRVSLNPGSAHPAVYHLRLEPGDGEVIPWEAGDIVEVQPGIMPEHPDTGARGTAMAGEESPATPTREYSAASVVEDGTLDLVVRQVRHDDGRLGLGSGWLTAQMPVGATVMLRVRANPAFRVPIDGRRLILIGNGTGMAGLRAHLRARACAGDKGHWLLFGERTEAQEAFFDDELRGWLADGTLARLDRAFSRDAGCGRYVQHCVLQAGDAVAAWIEEGAVILVCGSLKGMAQAVHAALAETIGAERLEALAEEGRYRRDVY